jgi:hypothetical protein
MAEKVRCKTYPPSHHSAKGFYVQAVALRECSEAASAMCLNYAYVTNKTRSDLRNKS